MNINHFTIWVLVGFLGQGIFFTRFFVQWIVSERKGKSVIPVSFWYLSIMGSLLLLSYACFRHDPVFIVGQTMGILIYVRNLIFIAKERKMGIAN